MSKDTIGWLDRDKMRAALAALREKKPTPPPRAEPPIKTPPTASTLFDDVAPDQASAAFTHAPTPAADDPSTGSFFDTLSILRRPHAPEKGFTPAPYDDGFGYEPAFPELQSAPRVDAPIDSSAAAGTPSDAFDDDDDDGMSLNIDDIGWQLSASATSFATISPLHAPSRPTARTLDLSDEHERFSDDDFGADDASSNARATPGSAESAGYLLLQAEEPRQPAAPALPSSVGGTASPAVASIAVPTVGAAVSAVSTPSPAFVAVAAPGTPASSAAVSAPVEAPKPAEPRIATDLLAAIRWRPMPAPDQSETVLDWLHAVCAWLQDQGDILGAFAADEAGLAITPSHIPSEAIALGVAMRQTMQRVHEVHGTQDDATSHSIYRQTTRRYMHLAWTSSDHGVITIGVLTEKPLVEGQMDMLSRLLATAVTTRPFV